VGGRGGSHCGSTGAGGASAAGAGAAGSLRKNFVMLGPTARGGGGGGGGFFFGISCFETLSLVLF